MDEYLKKRLLGATVLVALGVIFIPALLDNRGDERLTVKMEIPEKPEFDTEQALESLQVKKDALSETDLPPAPKRPVKTEPSSGLSTNQADTSDREGAKRSIGNKVAKTSDHNQRVGTDPVESDKNNHKTPSKAVERKWVLQLGSFSQESNANGLVNKLREANWKAYKEPVPAATGSVYRVRLGPIEERERAEDYRRQLVELGYKHTIIMGYP